MLLQHSQIDMVLERLLGTVAISFKNAPDPRGVRKDKAVLGRLTASLLCQLHIKGSFEQLGQPDRKAVAAGDDPDLPGRKCIAVEQYPVALSQCAAEALYRIGSAQLTLYLG